MISLFKKATWQTLIRPIPIFGTLILCRTRDHVKAIQEFFLTFFWGFLPILGSIVLFTLFPLNVGAMERAFNYIDNGTILIYTAAFIAPISYLTHDVFNESNANGSRFPHRIAFSLSFYAIIICAFIVHIGSEVFSFRSESEYLNPSIRWVTILVFVLALLIAYLGFVYRNALSGTFSGDSRKEEQDFAESWRDQK